MWAEIIFRRLLFTFVHAIGQGCIARMKRSISIACFGLPLIADFKDFGGIKASCFVISFVKVALL